MTAARPGWPAHRPNCAAADDSDVDERQRLVGGTRWYVRICDGCGAVALEPVSLQPSRGGVA